MLRLYNFLSVLPTSYSLLPTPYSLLPTPYSLLPTLIPLHFNSVDKILAQLENQPGWEKFREHRQLLQCWERVVSKQMAAQTRPLYITRQILYVATSSAARAQELSFQRYTLLKRLNKQLTFDLKEIRFSSSGWHQKIYQKEEQATLFTISDRHKLKNTALPNTTLKKDKCQNEVDEVRGSPVVLRRGLSDHLSPQDKAKEAAQRWLKMVEQRSLNTLPCPKCNSPTAKEELARWNLCHHCVAQQWSEKYRVPNFRKPE